MPIVATDGGSLGSFNVGLAVAVGLINPLSAQLDALLSVGLGPFMADLSVQFNAALSITATLSLQIGDPLAGLKAAINALAGLQAALQLALQLPAISLGLSAELSASAALTGALSARIGLLKLAISAALEIKIGAIQAAAGLAAQLSLPGIVAVAFGDGSQTFAQEGVNLASLLGGSPVDGFSMVGASDGDDLYFGVLLAASSPSAAVALDAIIKI